MPKQHGSGGRFGIGALGVAGILSAIGGTYKVAEFLVHMRKLHDVGEENAVFVRLLERVRLDLQETDRLLRIPEVQEVLEQNREKREYVLGVIDSTQRAVHDMAKFTERVDKDVKKKGGWFSLRRMTGMDVGLRNRIWWVLEEHERLLARRLEIATCHEGLVMVLGFLAKYEPLQGKGRGHRKNVVVVEDRHREHERVVERPEIRHETVYRKEYDDYERPPPTVVNVREERVHREHQEEEPRVVNVREERIYRDSYDGPHRPSREEPAEVSNTRLTSADCCLTFSSTLSRTKNFTSVSATATSIMGLLVQESHQST